MNEAQVKLQAKFKSQLPMHRSRRIVFWYDPSQSYEKEVEMYELPGVNILKVDDCNLIWTKHQIERLYPQNDFLLYFTVEKPHDLSNPLLDILLYGEEFHIDPLLSLMEEIGLVDKDSASFFRQNKIFFQNKKRMKEFRELISTKSTISLDTLNLAIFCVLARVKELSFSLVCEVLFVEDTIEDKFLWSQMERFASVREFWQMAYAKFQYESTDPTVKEFMLSIFVTKLTTEYEEKIPANWLPLILEIKNNSVVFLNRWMNSQTERKRYARTANFVAEELKISKYLEQKPLDFVAKSDSFSEIDDYLTKQIAHTLLAEPILYENIEHLIISRRNTFWQEDFKLSYQALIAAVRLLKEISQWENQAVPSDTQSLWDAYQNQFYQIDQYYRHFYLTYDGIHDIPDEFHHLQEKVENYYNNGFLNELAYKWSEGLGDKPNWSEKASGISQESFYKTHIRPFVQEKKRVIVIVSDALRYEAGKELAREFTESHYYTVDTHTMCGVIPSYTALGMASLLPHQQLSFQGNHLLVDGVSSQGLNNRSKILQNKFGEGKANALRASDLLQMTKAEMREVFTGGLVYYIYHDAIDAVGDHFSSEDRVFSAVENAKAELHKLADKLVNNISASNLFVTADHGFIYTRDPLTKSDKLPVNLEDTIAYNRRFYLNDSDELIEGMHTVTLEQFTSPQLYAHIPKGTMRFARSGSGEKFVHGGILPQEIMIPVLQIKAERGRDNRKKVTLQLISELNRITNVVTQLSFLQVQRVSSELLPRTIRAYFTDSQQRVVSNEVILTADSTSEEPQNRILKEKFIFANREYYGWEEYYLILEDEKEGVVIEKYQFNIDLYFFE